MPLITDDTELKVHKIGGSNFSFKGVRIEDLGASEYTLVVIAVDETSSTAGFQDDLRQALITAVDACKKSARSEYLMIRVVYFTTSYNEGVKEIHGFVPLNDIDTTQYPDLEPKGATPLCDAAFSSVGAVVEYGKELKENDFMANAIVFIITDGEDNQSTETPKSIANQIERVRKEEVLESLVTILIGINASECKTELDRFKNGAKIDQYIDAGDATKGKLAKLAAFVSQSVSSTSQALGTGGPSQNISATF